MKSSAKARSDRAFLAVEALLDHLHPKADSADLVRTLKEHFGSADAMLCANPHMLEELGVHPSDALLISRLPELTRMMRRVHFEKYPQLGRLRDASKYLPTVFHGLQVERFCLFCLDARGRLREQVLIQEGTSDEALFDLRRILSEALRTRANAVILSHNHPGLTLRPSQNDINCTREAIRALTTVGIPLLDHVVVAGAEAVSVRQYGFISASQWLNQYPGHPLLEGWLRNGEEDA